MSDDDLAIRPAAADDTPTILALLAEAMGRADDDRFGRLLEWKHRANPFGPSYEWVAVADGEIIGYRAFLRWELTDGTRTWRAVRAVDTATAPAAQGRGVFRRLTLHGLDRLAADGVDLVFNTPNDQSRPGYLRMGWELVGRLDPAVRVRTPGAVAKLPRARQAASHWGEVPRVGRRADEVFADEGATAALLAASGPLAGLRTRRTPAWLRWRYDADLLEARVLTLGSDLAEGACAFRVRRRGSLVEATVGDLLVPGDDPRARRALLGAVHRGTGADVVLLLGHRPGDRAIRVPKLGPTLVHRALAHDAVAPPRERWAFTMGDVELL